MDDADDKGGADEDSDWEDKPFMPKR